MTTMATKVVTIMGITGKQVRLNPLLNSNISPVKNIYNTTYSLTERRVPLLPTFFSEREAGTSAA